MRRLLVTGNQRVDNKLVVINRTTEALKQLGLTFQDFTDIIRGDSIGPEYWIEVLAKTHLNLPVRQFKKGDIGGKHARAIRNREMVDHVDEAVVFDDPDDANVQQLIRVLKETGTPFVLINPAETDVWR